MEKTCEQNMNLSSGCGSYLSSLLKMHLRGTEDKKGISPQKGGLKVTNWDAKFYPKKKIKNWEAKVIN